MLRTNRTLVVLLLMNIVLLGRHKMATCKSITLMLVKVTERFSSLPKRDSFV